MKRYTMLMLSGHKDIYKFDVIAIDPDEAVKRARELTGDKFVSHQSNSTKLTLVNK